MMKLLIVFIEDHLIIIIIFDYFVKKNEFSKLVIPFFIINSILCIQGNFTFLTIYYFSKIHYLSILNF